MPTIGAAVKKRKTARSSIDMAKQQLLRVCAIRYVNQLLRCNTWRQKTKKFNKERMRRHSARKKSRTTKKLSSGTDTSSARSFQTICDVIVIYWPFDDNFHLVDMG